MEFGRVANLFGLTALKPFQVQAIQSVINKKDTFVFLPTGAGKTICFQIPPVYLSLPGRPKAAVIISPLLSLIQQQTTRLIALNFKACCITAETKKEILPTLQNGGYNFIYLTPEQADSSDVIKALHGIKESVCLFVIDEAHCVVQASDLYRPEYMKLGHLKSKLEAPVMVLTATQLRLFAFKLRSIYRWK